VIGKVVTAERHPERRPAHRLHGRHGGGRRARTIVLRRAETSAAGQTVGVALPGAVMARRQTCWARPSSAASPRAAMILAEDEGRRRPTTTTASSCWPDSFRRRASRLLDGGDPWFERGARPRGQPETGPTLLSVYGVAPRGAHDHPATRSRPRTRTDEGRRAVRRRPAPEDHVSIEIDPSVCLRFHRPRLRRRADRGRRRCGSSQRLIAAGQRPISKRRRHHQLRDCWRPGQAAAARVSTSTEVRGGQRSSSGRGRTRAETITTLDDVERQPGPVDRGRRRRRGAERGSPGSWGGQISEVSGTTTRVLMEAATWVGPNIMRLRRRKLGLRSEALYPVREAAPSPANAIRRPAAGGGG